MAYLDPVLGEYIEVAMGNGIFPNEVFSKEIIFNDSTAVSFSTNSETDELPNLSNLSAPAQTVRRIRSFDFKVDGTGKMGKTDAFAWIERMKAGEIINVKVSQVGEDGWTITCPMVVSSFQITAQRVKLCEVQVTLEMASALTAVENA